MKLSCIRKIREGKFFRLRLSKDVRKTIIPSFMFLLNLLRSVVLYVKKM